MVRPGIRARVKRQANASGGARIRRDQLTYTVPGMEATRSLRIAVIQMFATSALLVALVLTGLTSPVGFGQAAVQGAPQLRALVFNQDRPIRPRRTLVTTAFCPFRGYVPFTWGFRPIGPRQAGVFVNAILTSVEPAVRGTRTFGYKLRLHNPNAGATVQMRISTTCVAAIAGVQVQVNRSGELFDRNGQRALASARGPTATLDGSRTPIVIPAGRRASASAFCTQRNAVVTDAGFQSRASEPVAFVPARRRGRPGVRVTLQNRTSARDRGDVIAVCLEGAQLTLETKQGTLSAAPRAAAGDGLLIEEASTSRQVGAGALEGVNVTCGLKLQVTPPDIPAVALGPYFAIGGGGSASDQFLDQRFSGLFDNGAARAPTAHVSSVARGIAAAGNATRQPTTAAFRLRCLKGKGNTSIRG